MKEWPSGGETTHVKECIEISQITLGNREQDRAESREEDKLET